MKHARILFAISLIMIILAVSAAGCDYVGSENIYGLDPNNFDLLAKSSPLLTSQFDTVLEAEITLGEQQAIFNMEGGGATVVYEDSLLPGMQWEFSGEVQNPTRDIAVNMRVEIRSKDGSYYMRITNLDTGDVGNWQRVDMGDYLDMISIIDPEMLLQTTPTPDGEVPPGMENLTDLFPLMEALSLHQFTTIRVLGDEEINGVDTRHFLIELDMLEFLTSEEMVDMLLGMAPLATETMGELGNGMEDGLEDVIGGDALTMIAPMLKIVMPMLVPTFRIQVDEYVGLVDRYQQRSVTTLDMEIDLSALEMFLGPAFSPDESDPASLLLQPIDVFLYVKTDYHDYGEPFEVEVPDFSIPVTMFDIDVQLLDD